MTQAENSTPTLRRTPTIQGYVYFATAIGSDATKVGWTHDPEARIKQIQGSCPLEIVLDIALPGIDIMDEQIVHSALRAHRIRGEWFSTKACWELLNSLAAIMEIQSVDWLQALWLYGEKA
jgi:hypothetical protein